MTNTQLFFIFDTHCPWSYATLPLVNKIAENFEDLDIHLYHCARYEGDENISQKTLIDVSELSSTRFLPPYTNNLSQAKDSTLAANLCAWVQYKLPQHSLTFINSLMNAHFVDGNELTSKEALDEIVTEYKMFPPAKTYSLDKLTRNAEMALNEIEELQDIIDTKAIPALLLAVDDRLILLNHNPYLSNIDAIVEAVKLEVKSS